jgi:hypothetical protein
MVRRHTLPNSPKRGVGRDDRLKQLEYQATTAFLCYMLWSMRTYRVVPVLTGLGERFAVAVTKDGRPER